jgi:hypothetical protein
MGYWRVSIRLLARIKKVGHQSGGRFSFTEVIHRVTMLYNKQYSHEQLRTWLRTKMAVYEMRKPARLKIKSATKNDDRPAII